MTCRAMIGLNGPAGPHPTGGDVARVAEADRLSARYHPRHTKEDSYEEITKAIKFGVWFNFPSLGGKTQSRGSLGRRGNARSVFVPLAL